MKPCRSCGATEVTRWTYPLLADPGREGVVVECAGCGNRRSTYTRRKS